MSVWHAERDSGGYGSVGSPVGGPECRSDYDGLQAQCDQAMHQLQLLRHKHSDTIRRFVLVLFNVVLLNCFVLPCLTFCAKQIQFKFHIYLIKYLIELI